GRRRVGHKLTHRARGGWVRAPQEARGGAGGDRSKTLRSCSFWATRSPVGGQRARGHGRRQDRGPHPADPLRSLEPLPPRPPPHRRGAPASLFCPRRPTRPARPRGPPTPPPPGVGGRTPGPGSVPPTPRPPRTQKSCRFFARSQPPLSLVPQALP